MGAIEGKPHRHGPLITYSNNITASTTIQTVLLVKNPRIFNSKPNQSVIHIRSLTASTLSDSKAGNELTYVTVRRNPTITGNPVFSQYDATHSCALFSNTTTTAAVTNESQNIFSIAVTAGSQIDHSFDSDSEVITIQPGEIIAVTARTTTGTVFVNVTLNTREDQ